MDQPSSNSAPGHLCPKCGQVMTQTEFTEVVGSWVRRKWSCPDELKLYGLGHAEWIFEKTESKEKVG